MSEPLYFARSWVNKTNRPTCSARRHSVPIPDGEMPPSSRRAIPRPPHARNSKRWLICAKVDVVSEYTQQHRKHRTGTGS